MSEQGGKQKKQSPVSEKILEWVGRLSVHFGTPLDDEQVKIFLHALKDNTTYQIEIAFDRCMNECQFMPKLKEIHERMPAEKWPRRDAGFTQQRSILELVREIGRELYPNYDQLEGQELLDAVIAANRERYRRMGIDPDNFAGRAGT